ncbi:MAG: cupin domain-containing protein [candidate division WOR-3 bacterium]|nr:MAG: cupin domain-containing protein [candidate division WOR-3 bacterium]
MNNDSRKTKELISRVIDLKGIIDYQKNAVVSSEVISKKTGTVTVFAFDAGQGLSEHTAPFDAFVYIIDGVAEITISGDKHSLKAGEMIIMPANEPHALKAIQKFKMLLVMIKS